MESLSDGIRQRQAHNTRLQPAAMLISIRQSLLLCCCLQRKQKNIYFLVRIRGRKQILQKRHCYAFHLKCKNELLPYTAVTLRGQTKQIKMWLFTRTPAQTLGTSLGGLQQYWSWSISSYLAHLMR